MIENFLTVTAQVLSLFIMIFVGFLLGKLKLITENATTSISNIILYVATPAAVLQAFLSETPTKEKNINLLLIAVFAIIAHILGIVLSKLLIRNKLEDTKAVLHFGAIFSNCGYMSFPLQKAILGDIGIFYGAMYVAVFSVFYWSYGAAIMNKEKTFSFKKIILNPATIATFLSLILYFVQLKLPVVVGSAVTALGNLNTPLPMIIIGYYLSTAKISAAFTDKRIYLASFLRLLLIPSIMLVLMLLCGVRGVPLIASVVATSAPAAAAGTMFSIKFGRDTLCSVNAVTFTTLLSILTMPLFVALAQLF